MLESFTSFLAQGLEILGLSKNIALRSVTLLLFVIGLVMLIKGADALVLGASSIAKRFRLSDMIIGLTIVAFGTSTPELLVNVSSSLKGATGITLGNVLWSNIVNILLILGLSALISPLHIAKKLLTREMLFMFVVTVLLFLMVNGSLFGDGASFFLLSRGEGLIMLLLFALFLSLLIKNESTLSTKKESWSQISVLPLSKSILFVVFGLAGLILGGEWIVNSAIWSAQQLGMSERLIGLTIIAVGTSLPELTTSVLASLKGKNDIAVGNIVGSNIFNILFILWVSVVIAPIRVPVGTNIDLTVLLIATFLVFLFGYGFWGKRGQMTRGEWLLLLLIYVLYLFFLIIYL